MAKKTCNLTLDQGNYLGEVIEVNANYPRAIQAFRGIPFAQSTAFENRFKPPQALTSTAKPGVITHAINYGQICPQGSGSSGQGENCLNSNIYRPHFGDTSKEIAAEEERLGVDSKNLPVVIFVPGGAFNEGSGKTRNMASFASWAESPIIAISFNYRVGALGFLPSSVTAKEGLLNLGLKDQQFFFEWARVNLPAIGGNPNNVTIMGQSAGAHSVGHHLVSYSPANTLISDPPPFQKAIMESGATTARAVYVPNHPLHEQQFQEYINRCGLGSVPNDELFSELRKLSYSKVVGASQYIWANYEDSLRWPFQPVIDGKGGIIPDLPISSWKKGNVLRIPIITGFNTNEGTTFVPQGEDSSSAVSDLMSSLIPSLNDTDIDTLDNVLYPDPTNTTDGKALYANDDDATGFGTQFWRLSDAYSDYAYICPVLQTAHYASTASDAASVYVYHFAARSAKYGAADHGDESKFVIHDVATLKKYTGVSATADVMTEAFSRFVTTGDPNPSKSLTSFTWPKYISPLTDSGDNSTTTNDGAGKLALFGNGNTEQMGTAGTQDKGVAAQVVTLSERRRKMAQFWWPRVYLSEGYDNGTTSISPEQKLVVKSKL
ncbi:carboxylesterase 3 [Xylariaceae sp. FL1019]|nr:carboxylesterase 3 [Xylariaceae sp. FL1019]